MFYIVRIWPYQVQFKTNSPQMMNKHTLILFVLAGFVLMSGRVFATHNRAGEIWIKQLGDCNTSLTVEATIVTYTKASSVRADRDSLEICWGDGTCEKVVRINGPGNPPKGDLLENDTKVNYYKAVHTYAARGQYRISMNDPNRNGGILNVNYPNSEQVRFHIETIYTFPNPQFQGCNNTPILLEPPIYSGCVGQIFTYNPGAYDEEGDSLSYHFTVPLQESGVVVPNYQFPDQISPGMNNSLTINEKTGDIVWSAPQRAGEYNLAIIIVEYRNGVPLDTMVRDMQILIENCSNEPPIVNTSVEEICVVAGQLVQIEVSATAPEFETNQKVRLTASGGPFAVTISPATFEPDDANFVDDPVNKTFKWQTTCEHISNQYYSVLFKGVDNFFGDTFGLATIKLVRIKVVGPPPEDVRANSGSGEVELSWELPYACDQAEDDYFRGFTIWRKEGSAQFDIDTCTPGLAGRGYTQLNYVPTKTIKDGRYYYLDTDVERGRTYCYRILAEFAKTTPGGLYVYNQVSSLPSDEVCIQLNRDLPLITHADVEVTDTGAGEIRVCWSKPKAEDLDTVLNKGPYVYEVLRANNQTDQPAAFAPIGVSFTSPYFATANDTCFTDTGLNTKGQPYTYIVNFYVEGRNRLLGPTNPASSVFLTIAPTDNANILTWTELVPWENYDYEIYRRNAQGDFEKIARTSQSQYKDTGLINGREYCYYVRAIGSYGVEGVISPLINDSQEACQIPVDNVAPCPPELTVENICGKPVDCSDPNVLVNTLKWINPMELCDETDDVTGYRIYYSSVEGGNLVKVADIDFSGEVTYAHHPDRGIAGCYVVTAVDTFFNESPFSNEVCVDNCPFYELPNTFTPNGDGKNDLFVPYPFCFVDQVEFQVFNRWGQVVFETNDPHLNWNGTNLKGEDLAEGTYYYTCLVYEQRVEGTILSPVKLSGFIELIR